MFKKKPYYVRNEYDYKRVLVYQKYLQEQYNTIKPQQSNDTWRYEFSEEKYAYEGLRELINKEIKYVLSRIKDYRKRYPEDFI